MHLYLTEKQKRPDKFLSIMLYPLELYPLPLMNSNCNYNCSFTHNLNSLRLKYTEKCLCFYFSCEFDKKVCDNSFPGVQEKVFFTLALPFLHAILEL